MPGIKRRHFLQSGAAALTAIGLSQFDFFQQASRFDRVVAQKAPRKFALLVGINDYRAGGPLDGCVNDVKLMQSLLEHRYGFDPANIAVLTDAQATREGILTKFKTHLIEQAQPGDVVVFHFSGHGWMVLDPDPNPDFVYQGKGVNGTIIPYDWDQGEPKNVRSIMGHTLFLLMSALKTENVTVVLDSCHSGGGLRGNSKIRAFNSRSGDELVNRPAEELAYQQEWLKKLSLSEAEFQQKRKQGIAKGVGLGGATLKQEAKDASFDGFNAGAFTYTLTRYLWQLPIAQPLETMYTNLQLGVQLQSREQLPVYEAKPGSQNQQQPIFFSTSLRPAAEGVITKTAGQELTAWLGGVSPNALTTYQPGAVLTVIDAQGRAIGEFEQTVERQGLEIKGKIRSGNGIKVEKGTLLRQKIVGVPVNTKLKVGLDPSLGEAADSIQKELSGISWLELSSVRANQPLDCILGRMSASNLKRLQSVSSLPPANAISLFSADLTPLPDSFVPANESISTALGKLRPRLKSLLATRLLKSILGDTSPLQVSADVFPVDGNNKPIAPGRTISSRGLQTGTLKTQSIKTQPLKLGSTIGVRVKNAEPSPLYVAALVISDTGELGVLFPFGFEAPDEASLVKPKSEFPIPVPFEVYGTPGYLELLILASKQPLRNALLSLKDIARSRGINRGEPAGLEADETSKVVGDLLGDIDKSSRGSGLRIPSSYRAFDTGKLAALSAVFQVVQ